ncbi:cobalamin B12-binding domain-containing protein, partial [Candidatus Aerophobetes bacterium]|nr:cobalamin B12-binding domain-containing protein [Candidatus Aerophobetes bacterium]
MRVLLVNPPSRFILKDKLGIIGIPLGLAYLAAFLEKWDHEVRIIDAPAVESGFEDIEKEIVKFSPGIVGVTATTSNIYDAYKVAQIAKMVKREILVVAGGPHVTFTAKQTLQECPFIDVIVRGEGEETFQEIVNFFQSSSGNYKFLEKISGITYRLAGKIVENKPRFFIKNLDSIPFPAYHLLPMEHYNLKGKRFGNVMTSRGCPFSCI